MKKIITLSLLCFPILIFSGCEESQSIIAPAVEETWNQNIVIVSDSWDRQRISLLEKQIADLSKQNEQLLSDYQDLQNNITNCNTMIAQAQSHSDGSTAEMKEALENLHSCYEEYDREYTGE